MKFTFCYKSTNLSNPESGSTTEEQPVFTLYGSGEAYDGDYFELDSDSASIGLAAVKRDESYIFYFPGYWTPNGWDLSKINQDDRATPVFGTTKIYPQQTDQDTYETHWDRTYNAGLQVKQPQIKILDGIEFVVILYSYSTGTFSDILDILPKIRGFYTWDATGNYWTNQRGTARIIQKNDKFYFNINLSDINDFIFESIGSPSSPVCQYQTMDGTKIDSGEMAVKFAHEAFGG